MSEQQIKMCHEKGDKGYRKYYPCRSSEPRSGRRCAANTVKRDIILILATISETDLEIPGAAKAGPDADNEDINAVIKALSDYKFGGVSNIATLSEPELRRALKWYQSGKSSAALCEIFTDYFDTYGPEAYHK